MPLTDETLRWFKDRRGIDSATLEAFGIDSEGAGITMPYPDGAVKHRKSLEKDENGRHKMWFDPKTPDSRQRLFLPPEAKHEGKTAIVLEGESDTMATWQHAPADVKPHIKGLGGAGAFGDKGMTDAKIQEYFANYDTVFFVLDNEDPYEGSEAYETVQRAKRQIKSKLGKKAKFASVVGAQDTAEFFQTFDWAAFMECLKDASIVKYHFPALDFSQPRPEREWLAEGLIGKGEIVLISGDGGTGKSLLLNDLAVHIARGDDHWLGMKLNAERTMVIDQENPDVEVWDRLFALGFDPTMADKLRYIWYQSILLDDPETVTKLYEDVTNYEPTLLILDSLSRMHLRNENANEEMNPLINGAIYPLARNLGITVILIHHTRKDGRTRGATAIRNAVDLSLEIDWDSPEKEFQVIRPDKPRAITARGTSLYVRKEEDDLGHIKLTTEEGSSVF